MFGCFFLFKVILNMEWIICWWLPRLVSKVRVFLKQCFLLVKIKSIQEPFSMYQFPSSKKLNCSNSTIEALEKVWNMLTLKAVFSSVSIVDFEQVNVWWVLILIILIIIRLHKWCKGWKFRFDIKITQQVGYLNAKKEVNHFR